MNASTYDGDVAGPREPLAAPHPTHKFRLLLLREFWEHKGGFFWAPVVAGAIVCFLTLLGLIGISFFVRRAMNGQMPQLDGEDMRFEGFIGDGALMVGLILASVVLVFVVFFYALGSIYDERKDRSVLFWKSLPVSDAMVVASKATWALLLAPVLAMVIGLVIGLAIWILGAIAMAANGLGLSAASPAEAHPFKVLGYLVSSIPVYALWALPTVGWLMLCSAWARTKPFLWAVLIPVLTCAVISWFDMFPGIEIPHGDVWYAVAFRLLGSIIPSGWRLANEFNDGNIDGNAMHDLDAMNNLQAFATADLWIGAVVGLAMIAGSVYYRRWRDDN